MKTQTLIVMAFALAAVAGCERKAADAPAPATADKAADKKAAVEEAAGDKAEALAAKPVEPAKPAEAPPAVPATPPAAPAEVAALAGDDAFAAPADVEAPPADAEKTASGLAWKVLQAGTGDAHPTAEAVVEVHYTGWQSSDGRMFDSSAKRGMPAKFPLNRVIKGWTEGVQLMVKGEKRRFWIPADLAYGETAMRPGAPTGMLVFDVELLGFSEPVAVVTPEDVGGVPADAQKTASGLASKVLQPGTGDVSPTAESFVEVHYSGWTTDGKLFDSSVRRGQPAQFPLNGVIKGWTEGVQLMKVGEKRRFWIPAELAYGDKPTRPGAPAGMLVFDVELLRILER